MITIRAPRIEYAQDTCTLLCDVDVDGGVRTVWFEVALEYGRYLCHERADAFLIGLLPWAMRREQDITCEAPVTEELLYNIREYLIPSLVRDAKTLYATQIHAPMDSSPMDNAGAVGTGCSCGIDSFHSILNNLHSPYPGQKLTHLTINNVGAFNDTYAAAGIEEVRRACYQRAKKVADELGLPIILSDSNFGEVFEQNHLFVGTYVSMFAVYAMQKFWKVYYYASLGIGFSKFSMKDNDFEDCAHYDLLSLNCFSTQNLRVYSEGGSITRLEKTQWVAESELARKYLHVCVLEAHNCGKCHKCKRTLLTLDALGKLDAFGEVFDVADYRVHRNEYLEYLYQAHRTGSDLMLEPVYRVLAQPAGDGTVHVGQDGLPLQGLQWIDGKLYGLRDDGRGYDKGWVRVGGKRYYCTGQGLMALGNFYQIDVSWYYFDGDGVMQTGLRSIGEKNYYFGDDGPLRIGLKTIDGAPYHFAADGSGSPRGWLAIGQRKYYSLGGGLLATGRQQIEQANCVFAPDGRLLAPETP